MEGRVDMHPAFELLEGKMVGEAFSQLSTPCYVIEEEQIIKNCEILSSVMKNTGCKILLAQKAFSNYDFYPLISNYLAGTEASGLYEARLGAEEMPEKEVHIFSAAYREDEFEQILQYADHVVFNSISQLRKFGSMAKNSGKSIGIRINPECSTQDGHEIYDPCASGSRLGVTREVWDEEMTENLVSMLDGLHFHTLCEQDSDALEITLKVVEEKFSDILCKMKWLNMGGGHHITRKKYDIERLRKLITETQNKWGVEVYLEPGEAVALNAGYMVSRVLDVIKNGDTDIAILDVSAACHMPDVIEMPYRPPLYQAEEAGVKSYTYRLAGPTCLAGDIIGDYSFDEELKEGDILIFGDMAIYSTCKNNTFNGMALPDIYKKYPNGEMCKLTNFGYEDFKRRLGR